MKRFFFILTFLFCSLFIFTLPVQAAELKSGETVTLPPTDHPTNVYAVGSNITSNAEITDDLVAAGGNITVHGSTTGSVMAAGGGIVIDGTIGNSIRAAGGTISIAGPITHDVVVAGGTVIIEKSASIGGDLIFMGGTLQVDGPVKGNILVQGGSVILSSQVGGNVEGEVTTLQLKNGTEIQGNLNYTSSQKALISDSAIIHGQEIYHATPKKDHDGLKRFLTTGAILKLITDILFALLLVYLFPGILKRINGIARTKTLKSGLVGLGFLLFVPVLAALMLLILWLGISLGLLYLLFLILALFVAKILLGWYVLEWWNKRNKGKYDLDWKAAVLGPLLLAILFIIPIIGWLAILGIYFVSLGALTLSSLDLRSVKE